MGEEPLFETGLLLAGDVDCDEGEQPKLSKARSEPRPRGPVDTAWSGSSLEEPPARRKAKTGEGYRVEVKINDKRTVHNAFVRFPDLLFDLGLSPYFNEIFSIKVEVDTKPPAGAILETTLSGVLSLSTCNITIDPLSLPASSMPSFSVPIPKGEISTISSSMRAIPHGRRPTSSCSTMLWLR